MPTVSVIVPCFNEERTIPQLLTALSQQDFPLSRIEVIIADGMSSDGTRTQIANFQKAHSALQIRILDNPTRTIPAGLNRAIASAKGDYIVRLDAHSVPCPDYISRCVAAIEAGRGWNVGGVWDIQPGGPGWMAKSIAIAAAHPLGVGDAFYRISSQAREVDTVPFGAFKKSLVSQIGPFDESLHSNEDYELNTRIRRSGGKVWLDPAIKTTYFARGTLGELAGQYARYGYWKWQMLRRYPGSLRLRQAVPPLFVLSLLVLPFAGLMWPWLHWVLLAEVVSYVALLIGAALLKVLEHRQISLLIGVPLAMATMHFSWGGAFLWSFLTPTHRKWKSRH
ncbi:MAG: glycosyltransferase family 2 protein [Anaerolineales bacterium]